MASSSIPAMNYHEPSSPTQDFLTFDLEAKGPLTGQQHTHSVTLAAPVDNQNLDLASSFDSSLFHPDLFQPPQPLTTAHSTVAFNHLPLQPHHHPHQQQHHHTLSHASSYSSLHSAASASDMGSGNGLWVTTDESPYATPYDHSRNSSFSFDPATTPIHNLISGDWTMPLLQQPVQPCIPLETISANRPSQPLFIETQRLGRTSVDRLKGTYRSQPYARQRSESLSVKSEADDDLPALLSASTNASIQTSQHPQTPWSNTLIQGVDRMTLHHRRTSSAASNTALNHHATSRRPMLSRTQRSFTVSSFKPPSQPDVSEELHLSGTPEDREIAVRNALTEDATAISTMTNSSQADKYRSIWVRRWLRLCYVHDVTSTVPRQGLYASYTISCEEYGLKPINSASFGKAVRNAYPGIRTRRLGHRGNSKYHYVSLRPAIRTEAERLNNYGDSSGQRHVALGDGPVADLLDDFSNSQDGSYEMNDEGDEEDDEDDLECHDLLDSTLSNFESISNLSQLDNSGHTTSTGLSMPRRPVGGFSRRHTTSMMPSVDINVDLPSMHVQTPVFNLPNFPRLAEQVPIPGELPAESFWQSFCQHQEALANCVRNLQWGTFSDLCSTFWAHLGADDVQASQQLHINELVVRAMACSFDHFTAILLEHVHVPTTSAEDLSTLRHFATEFRSVFEVSHRHFISEVSGPRVELAVRFTHLIIRIWDLQQVTCALAPFLSDDKQVKSLLLSWDKLDYKSLSDQCMLACGCEEDFLQNILFQFRQWLAELVGSDNTGEQSVEMLGEWLSSAVDIIKNRDLDSERKTSRSLVTKTGFITSQILRDFTLRSDSTFGIFQLIKTWVDDWVSVIVLRETALSIDNLEMRRTPSDMRVMIPSQSSTSRSLEVNTAIPPLLFHGHGVLMPGKGSLSFGVGVDHMAITPKQNFQQSVNL
ncbi:hypothetical protein BD324DRAFT_623092 [Kockovaella imperatae]|uniref:RFX-type winged-helix domain-containing protein n=1 Tax=Kockovaella imperatae TaxID=4999 RepID=A0A1Y1UJL9_9TREE|nr:hypothetical protein BD324DRAFT_623092 [Kockovaella imperatae]ORX37737.1 hypothetical protein BD324DRAFT_623092 [Kockovaella imperatae]